MKTTNFISLYFQNFLLELITICWLYLRLYNFFVYQFLMSNSDPRFSVNPSSWWVFLLSYWMSIFLLPKIRTWLIIPGVMISFVPLHTGVYLCQISKPLYLPVSFIPLFIFFPLFFLMKRKAKPLYPISWGGIDKWQILSLVLTKHENPFRKFKFCIWCIIR